MLSRHAALCISTALTSLYLPNTSADAVLEITEIVTTAQATDATVSTLGNTVHLLSADELRLSGLSIVAEALATLPEIAVTQSGGIGSATQIRVRGNEANHILILLDGIRINDPAAGEFNLADLSLNGIATIEVVLGPQTLLHGSDAIAGIINIKTQQATTEGYQGSLGVTTGSQDFQQGEFSFAHRMGNFSATVSGSANRSDNISAADTANGNRETDPYASSQAIVKLGYTNDRLSVDALYHTTDSSIFFDADDYVTGLPVDDSNRTNRSYTNNHLSGLEMGYRISENLTSSLVISKSNYRLFSISDYGFGPSPYRSAGDVETAKFVANYELGDSIIDLGLSTTTEGVVTDYFAFRELETNALFTVWRSTIQSKLDVSLGVRYDEHSQFGSDTNYRATLSAPFGNLRFIANAGSAFKSPTAQDLYGWGGNDQLRPEQAHSYELGLDINSDVGEWQFRSFWQETDNLIRSEFNGVSSQLQNIDSATADGVSARFSQEFVKLSHSFSWQWLNAEETLGASTQARVRVPEHSARYQIRTRKLFENKITFWGNVQYESSRVDSNWATGMRLELDDFWLISAGASAEYDHLRVTAAVTNLFDEDYQLVNGYGTPGTTAKVSVRLSL